LLSTLSSRCIGHACISRSSTNVIEDIYITKRISLETSDVVLSNATIFVFYNLYYVCEFDNLGSHIVSTCWRFIMCCCLKFIVTCCCLQLFLTQFIRLWKLVFLLASTDLLPCLWRCRKKVIPLMGMVTARVTTGEMKRDGYGCHHPPTYL
jgi:hypothetical protein